jgi:hypothetical protein
MATTIRSTDLDFDTIKNRLKDYLKEKDEFRDYDFEASGLSNLLDVLAYNTHMNGLIANFALNESFLNTAQLRSSVVSHAEALGYVPRSFTASVAFLNISIQITSSERPSSVTLPRGTTFSTSIGDTTYTFRTLEAYSATPDASGVYEFVTSTGDTSIPVYEGIERTKTFFVGEVSEGQVYVIPDVSADINTLLVRVLPTSSSSLSAAVTYEDLSTAVSITQTSRFYQIKEVPNGYYELLFGDGVSTGAAPTSGNKIVVTYLTPAGPDANGAATFEASSDLRVDGTDFPISVIVETASSGGSFKESIESIRQNAPIKFASQQRLVTPEDYTSQIFSSYNAYLDDVISWGGQDNDPVKFATVYVGLKFKDGISDALQQDIKNDIVNNLTKNLSIMSVETEFTDPVTTFLELSAFFNFDPDLTNITPRATENTVKELILDYFDINLKKFGRTFRRSNLLAEIDDLDQAILNSRMDVKVQQRFTPITGSSLGYRLNFPVTLASPDDENRILTSNRFTLSGKTCFIRNRLSSNRLEIATVAGEIVVDNVGFYEPGTGVVQLEGFAPTAIESATEIKISVIPANQSTLRPLRNYILDIDEGLLSARSQIDFQTTQISL